MNTNTMWPAVACLALAALVPVQKARAADSRVGGFLGVNLADRYGSESARDENMRVRSCAGGLVEIGFSERGALRIEPSLVGKGSQGREVDEPPMDGTFAWWRSFEYFEIPVLLKWRLGQTKTWTPYAIGGPSLGFLLVARYQSKGTGWYVGEQDHEVTGSFPRREFGLSAGAGVARRIATHKELFAEVRYALALSHTNDSKNRGLRINVGLTFDRK